MINLIPIGKPGESGLPGPLGPQGIPGLPGIDGKNIELQTTSTHIQWRLIGDSIWTNLISLSSITGPQGIQGIQGIQGPQGLQGLPGLPPSESWHFPIFALTENDPRLEGASFPKTLTITGALGRQTTVSKLAGLINTLSSGTAIITIQYGITSFTNITGLSTLACTTSELADQIASANNVIPLGNRIRILFTSITGTLNLFFRLDISEAL
ncbi:MULTISPECIES: collagen-like protein [unclassified Microcystis]|uniref:collagen-like triple helix repeat-containing protein n=1 Tax=unclassified Microcystis TaxID=2643300 RepID=UPI00118F606C|nr:MULTISPECIES: collagen-like protein [unclassified Microcystis]MCA2926995.1 collagen-like protein [Microcystis sp. M020S1]MCA2935672.1 collagen-like protein [Microcystis sp. M015S1]MCA2621227.1 collagen-like protein [Microcystis sp. M099S2]MCA2648576.1 collagen-like protein [Microcystis sp. M065S2]MCA2680779.1 collagen-like protein [Microcystis sp. M043S2]